MVFFFNDTATTEIYTLSLHDALPISEGEQSKKGYLLLAAKGNQLAHRFSAFTVSGNTRQAPLSRPTAIAIHNNGNMGRQSAVI